MLPNVHQTRAVDGDIGDATVAAKVAETAISKFGSIDALVTMPASSFRRRSPITRAKI